MNTLQQALLSTRKLLIMISWLSAVTSAFAQSFPDKSITLGGTQSSRGPGRYVSASIK